MSLNLLPISQAGLDPTDKNLSLLDRGTPQPFDEREPSQALLPTGLVLRPGILGGSVLADREIDSEVDHVASNRVAVGA
eukprot:5862395-Pyramimonas_sp.AAC.1